MVTTLQISPENQTASLVWSFDFTVVLELLVEAMRGSIPPDSRTKRPSGSLATRCPVILMLQASKGKGSGSILQRRGRLTLVAKSIGNGLKEFSGYLPQQALELALRTERRESDGEKLFHPEDRPALERHIIDTSERARANY